MMPLELSVGDDTIWSNSFRIIPSESGIILRLICILPAKNMYFKHMTIVNDNSSIVSKWSSKLIDDARVTIYDRHMLMVQAKDDTKTDLFQQPMSNWSQRRGLSFLWFPYSLSTSS
jgi:hypothetical protein